MRESYKMRIMLLVVIGIMSLLVFSIPVKANENISVRKESELTPYYVNVRSITCGLDISEGVATCKGNMSIQNATAGTIKIELQKKVDDGWKEIKSWTQSGTTTLAIKKSYKVSKGTYRLEMYYKCGADSGTKYSGIKVY